MSQQFKPNVGGRVCGKRKGVAQFRVEKESALSSPSIPLVLHVKRPVKRGRTAAEKEESVISEKPPQCLAVEHRQFKRPRRLEETLASLSVSASASNAGESEAQPRKRKAVYELHRTYEDEDIPDDVDRIVERAKRRREDRSEGEEPMGESFRYAPRKSRNAIGEPIPVGKGISTPRKFVYDEYRLVKELPDESLSLANDSSYPFMVIEYKEEDCYVFDDDDDEFDFDEIDENSENHPDNDYPEEESSSDAEYGDVSDEDGSFTPYDDYDGFEDQYNYSV